MKKAKELKCSKILSAFLVVLMFISSLPGMALAAEAGSYTQIYDYTGTSFKVTSETTPLPEKGTVKWEDYDSNTEDYQAIEK